MFIVKALIKCEIEKPRSQEAENCVLTIFCKSMLWWNQSLSPESSATPKHHHHWEIKGKVACLQVHKRLHTGIYIFSCQDISCSKLPMSTSALSFFKCWVSSRQRGQSWGRLWCMAWMALVSAESLRRFPGTTVTREPSVPNRPSGWKHPAPVSNFLELAVYSSQQKLRNSALKTKRLFLARRSYKLPRTDGCSKSHCAGKAMKQYEVEDFQVEDFQTRLWSAKQNLCWTTNMSLQPA